MWGNTVILLAVSSIWCWEKQSHISHIPMKIDVKCKILQYLPKECLRCDRDWHCGGLRRCELLVKLIRHLITSPRTNSSGKIVLRYFAETANHGSPCLSLLLFDDGSSLVFNRRNYANWLLRVENKMRNQNWTAQNCCRNPHPPTHGKIVDVLCCAVQHLMNGQTEFCDRRTAPSHTSNVRRVKKLTFDRSSARIGARNATHCNTCTALPNIHPLWLGSRSPPTMTTTTTMRWKVEFFLFW